MADLNRVLLNGNTEISAFSSEFWFLSVNHSHFDIFDIKIIDTLQKLICLSPLYSNILSRCIEIVGGNVACTRERGIRLL